ncbi:MAG: aldo/keto reductase [Myxococcota bacterium]
MQPRPLGSSGLHVSPIVYGTQAFARRDPGERVRTLHAAIDIGITSIDTAPLYEFGESERMVGRAIADRRDRVQVLSKVGLRWDDDHGEVLFTSNDESGTPRVVRRDGRPATVRRDVESSLQRMGIESLDLCQVHHPDTSVPLAETMGELGRLCDEGKVKAVGVCNFSAAQVDEARQELGDRPLASLQSEYSLLRREIERGAMDAVHEHGCGFLAYSPLLHGLLAGRMTKGRRLGLDDYRRYNPLFHPTNVARVEAARVSGLQPLARRHRVAEAQIALAWVLERPGVTAVIAGGSTAAQVRANATAAELRLLPGERAGLEAEFARVKLDPKVRPRKRDRLRERGERIAGKVMSRVSRRFPWL